jgi:hypothetical protein
MLVKRERKLTTKDNCSEKVLKIWLENLRFFCLTLHLHFNLVVYITQFKCKCSVKQKILKFSSQIIFLFLFPSNYLYIYCIWLVTCIGPCYSTKAKLVSNCREKNRDKWKCSFEVLECFCISFMGHLTKTCQI